MDKIFLLFLTCGVALAADPSPTPGDSEAQNIHTVAPVAEPAPTPEVFHVDIDQQLRQWVRLSQSIDKLQKTIDQLTEEVEMFSQQLAEQINESQPQPTPTPAQ